jgi:hypothetical protein
MATFIGILAGLVSRYLPKTIVYNSIQVGDIFCPLVGLDSYLAGNYAYQKMYFDGSPAVLYPFTAMLSLYPFTFIEIKYVAPLFCAFITTIFTYALLATDKPWRLLTLLSVPFISALQSIQFAPLMAAAILLPSLLPVATLKPQLGVVMLAAGSWTKNTIFAAIAFVVFSLVIYPTWPADWLKDGNLSMYQGKVPLTQGIGFVLLLSLLKFKEKRSRILLVMSLIPQRLWYDQLMLFLIPETRRELLTLVIGSWLSLVLSLINTNAVFDSGSQSRLYWNYVIVFQFIPSLLLVFKNEIRAAMHKLVEGLLKRFSKKFTG